FSLFPVRLKLNPGVFSTSSSELASSPSTFDLCSLIATFTCSQYPLPPSFAESFDAKPKPTQQTFTFCPHKHKGREPPFCLFLVSIPLTSSRPTSPRGSRNYNYWKEPPWGRGTSI
ncbi:hypothetical protein F2P56_031037, partial [Juglans regia]